MDSTTNSKPAIGMTPCKSSMLSAHGYDPASKTLALTFKNGKTYHYEGVGQEKYDAMCKCESIGRFFGSEIREQFKCVPIGGKDDE